MRNELAITDALNAFLLHTKFEIVKKYKKELKLLFHFYNRTN